MGVLNICQMVVYRQLPKCAMLLLMTTPISPITFCAYTQSLIRRINRKSWWHVPPIDPKAYKKRGKFYSSSFAEAEFYGRPGDPERVTIVLPIIGDELHIERILLGECPSVELVKLPSGKAVIAARFTLDARLKKAAIAKGYDSIALLSPTAWSKFVEKGEMPRSIELNVFV